MMQLLRGVVSALPMLARPGGLLAAAGTCLVIAAVVFLRPILPPWGWYLCLAAIALGGLIGVLVKGLPWYRQRRFMRTHDGVVASGEGAPGQALERRLMTARDVILHSPSLSAGRDPLYRLPWYLVLATDDRTAQNLLRPPLTDSPIDAPPADDERVWSWWFYNGLVAIQVPAAFVCEPGQTEVRAVWYQALRLLDRHRPKLPANGVMIVLAAALLTSPADALREACARLRRLLDEALRLLQIEAPVYLVVAGCETLPHIGGFAQVLPDEAKRRVLGHRFKPGEDAGRAFKGWLNGGFDEFRSTLHAVRLGLLPERVDPRTRRAVFGFVESFEQLRDGLAQAGAALFEDNTYQRRPSLAGVFFTGGEMFVSDLFTRFLPADQPLARKRRRSRLVRWSVAVAVAGALLAGSALLADWILTNSREFERLAATAEEVCRATPRGAEAVAVLAACREGIAGLAAARHGRRFDLGLGHAARVEAALKSRYVAQYGNLILTPLDRAFDAAIRGGALRFSDHLALARRHALLRQCLAGDECGALEAAPVFEGAVVADLPALAAPDTLPTLALLHREELRWASGEELAAQQEALGTRLDAAYQRQPPTAADIIAWSAARAAPVGLAEFWRRSAAVSGAPEVAAAFRHAQWTEGPARLLADLADASVMPRAEAAVADHLRRYVGGWQDFVVDFDRGALAWSDDLPGLIALLGGDKSPYTALWQTLEAELFPLDEAAGVPPWPKALAATLAGPWAQVESTLRSLFLELSDDDSDALGYQLASAIYGGAATANPTVDKFRQIQAVLETPPAGGEPLSLEGQRAWRVVRQPLSLWLRIVNARAGAHLDRAWREQVVEPARAQSERQRDAFLFGPSGRVAAFRETWLRPLLVAAGAAGQLGAAPPIANEFLAFLEGSAAGPAQSGPIYAGSLAIAGPARFGPLAGAPGGTSFTLSCLGANQTASDASPQQAVLTLAWSPDRCFEVRIAVALPPDLVAEGEPPPVLVRTYAGPDGFLDFIADFRRGPRAVSLAEFTMPADARAALAGSGVARVTVPIELELSEVMLAWLAQPEPIRLPSRVSPSAFASSRTADRLQ